MYNPKSILLILTLTVLLYGCSNETVKVEAIDVSKKITFIGSFDNADNEVVIKKKARSSVIEDQYYVLNHNDTIAFETEGRAFFMGGIKASVLDTLIVDQGDVVQMYVRDDSLQVIPEKSDLLANQSWYNDFFDKVEDTYEGVFDPIKEKTANSGKHVNPMLFYNEYETEEVSLNYIYKYNVDNSAYLKNKEHFDNEMREAYTELESLITNSDLDEGSKKIMEYALFYSTVNTFRRTKSYLQDWMFEKINVDLANDCDTPTTDITEYYLQCMVGKTTQKTTFIDLEKVYREIDGLSCSKFEQELQRLCLEKMLSSGNNLATAEKLLDEYISDTQDTLFQNFVERNFNLKDHAPDKGTNESLLFDINKRGYSFSDIMEANRGKVVLVDFWASWCAPCRKSLPHVKELEERYKGKDFKVIYASIDKLQSQWEKASKDEDLTSRNSYIISNFHESDLYKDFSITHVPRYIIYDKSGKAVYPNAPKPELMGEIIDGLLSE